VVKKKVATHYFFPAAAIFRPRDNVAGNVSGAGDVCQRLRGRAAAGFVGPRSAPALL